MGTALIRRSAALALVLCLALVPAALPPGSAPAAEAAQQLAAPRLVEAHYEGLALSWPAVQGARYELRQATSADFSDPVVTEKVNSRYAAGLANATTYYFQYRTLTRPAGTPTGEYRRSSWSGTLRATTAAAYPGEISVTVGRGADSVRVSWNRVANATKYSVLVADNHAMTKRPRKYSDITGTSLTVSNLTHGSRSGMPVFVKVYAHNKDYRTRFSNRITSYAAAPKVGGSEPLSVASLNLLCPSCRVSGVVVPHWNTRVATHLRTIAAKNPDVLLMQEAINMNIPGSTVRSMVDLRSRLKKLGYALDRIPEDGPQYANRIAYKTAKYTVVKRGTFALPVGSGESKRGAAWLLLKSKATGRQFYAVSLHVSPLLPVTGAVSRTSTMQIVDRKMAALNPGKLPVVAGGDMNSSFYVAPSNTPHEFMVRAGWTDTASSASRIDYLYPTTNGYRKQVDQSFGRIDYVFTKNIAGTASHENVLNIDSAGRLRSVPGSDHNMVLAKVKLR